MAATSGSSALRIATPPSSADGSASTSSPLVWAIASREPNSPRCAVPTLSTTPIRGGAMLGQRGDMPGSARGHLEHQEPGPASARSAVHGWPSSLLNDPGGATTGPSGAQHGGEQILGRRLARRAGDADDGQAGPAAGRRRTTRASSPARRAPRRRSRRSRVPGPWPHWPRASRRRRRHDDGRDADRARGEGRDRACRDGRRRRGRARRRWRRAARGTDHRR